ncbi:MAG TPA: hypothetical protein VIJ23_00195 [Mycobacterium sp.]
MAGRVLSARVAVVIALGCSPAASADCVVTSSNPSTIDGVLADIPGVTVTPGCPDIASPFAGADMAAATAGEISRDGANVMTVFAGELAAGDGQAFVHDRFLAASPGAASESQTVGGYQVTYFNIPRLNDGYAYADGPTVVIAYDTASPPTR